MATASRSFRDAEWGRAALIMLLVWALSLVATPAVPSAEAAEEPKDPCAEFDYNEGADSDELAAAIAKRCDRKVPVAEGRTEFSDAVMRPDGTGEFTAYAEPVRARNDKNDWAPIDTSLQVRDDGSIEPGNTVVPVTISGGGKGDFARIKQHGKVFGLSWPGRLPAPSIDGDTATYAEVLPGVDLTVTALPMGFSHNLVVKDREAAGNQALNRVRFGVTTEGGVAVRQNNNGKGLEVAGGGKPWLVSPIPRMWDSPKVGSNGTSARPGAGHPNSRAAKEATVRTEIGRDSLTLVPDQDVLRGDDTEYPVIIDPPWTADDSQNDWASVSEKYPNTSYWNSSHLTNKADFGGAGVGRVCDESYNFTCYSPSYRMRSFFRMRTAYVTRNDNRVLKAARFKITQKHAWVCQDSSPLSKARVERISSPKTTHTWNNQPAWYNDSARSTDYANYGAACTGGPGTVIFPVWNIVKWAKDNKKYYSFLGMRAIDESTVAQWKRYGGDGAKLTLEYNTKPQVPKNLKYLGGKSCQPKETRPWYTSRSATMSGEVVDADGGVRGKFQLDRYNATNGWTQFANYTSGFRSSGSRVYWNTSKTLTDGQYRWRMKADDGDLSSAYSSWCHFRIDATPPTNLSIDRVGSGDLAVGDTLTVNVSATDKNGIKRFDYAHTDFAFDYQTSATNNSATIKWPNLEKGRHILYVRAVDGAGNRGVEPGGMKQHSFCVGCSSETIAKSAFRLDGDGVDDSGEGQNLTVPAAATWTADRDGNTDSAVHVDGQDGSCLETNSGLLDTSTSFSASAWVRPDSLTSNGVVFAQIGTDKPSFVVRHDATSRLWRVFVSEMDDPDTTWRGLRSPTDVAVGEWVHLAVTFDLAAGVMKFYMDGSLVDEGEIPWPTWDSSGPLTVGCVGHTVDGNRWAHFDGAIDHVGMWQGVMTPEQIARAATELPAGANGSWSLDGSGDDVSGFDRPLTVPSPATWTTGEYGRKDKALALDGQAGSCLESAGPIVRTGMSYSVAGWAKLDSAAGDAVVVAQAGGNQPGFALRYSASADTWVMSVVADNAGQPVVLSTQASNAAVRDEWTHVAAVIDATDRVARVYVNGELSAERSLAHPVWEDPAAGPLLVGCDGTTSDGARSGHFLGDLSGVTVYRGVLTNGDVARLVSNPGVTHLAKWPLQGSYFGESDPALFTDVLQNGHDLSEPTNYSWIDRMNDPAAALSLPSGSGACADTTGRVVRTDESFTVAAWINLDGKSGDRIVTSQAAVNQQSFVLKYDSAGDRWTFGMPSADVESPVWATATSTSVPTVGEWTHLAGVFDLEHGKVRLYVDGQLEDTVAGPTTPWHVDGPFIVGCSGLTNGERSAGVGGAVDDVHAWKSVLHEDRILDLGTHVPA